MSRKIILLFVIAVLIVGIVVLINKSIKKSDKENSDKIKVTASFYPLYFFAKEIGGEKVEVINITPSGTEPHDYELTTQDFINIESSDVLILNGAGLESWGNDVLKNLSPEKTRIIAGEGLFVGNDPHVWLSPVLAQHMAGAIGEALGDATSLREKLQALDVKYRQGLSNCKQKNIITPHRAFGYLAAAYGFKEVPITGLSPEAEPSAQELANIADFARKNNIKYIFFDSLASPKLSQTLAKEIGAQTLALNSLEGLSDKEIAQGKNYFTEMETNLANLQIALQCQK